MKSISILVLFIFLQTGYAQSVPSVDDHYHSAAQAYIHSKIPIALSEIQAGLALQPSHPKLQALLEKIKEQQKNKDQQDQQNKENDESKEQQQQDQKEQQKNKDQQDRQKESDENGEKKEDKEKEQSKQEKEKQDSEDKKEQQKQPPAEDPNGEKAEEKKLSREAALQLLKALENEEKNNKIKQRPIKSEGVKRDRDW